MWAPAQAQMLLKDENLSLMLTGIAMFFFWGGWGGEGAGRVITMAALNKKSLN